jgi:hypothetical protein
VKLNLKKMWVYMLLASFPVAALAQKVRTGYDKGTDFQKFKSYTWAQPTMPATRPLLYASIVGTIDYELKSKGLTRVERDGDLILIPAGGLEFGLNVAVGTPILPTYGGAPPMINSGMWTGAAGPSNLMAPYVPEGTLMLTFVERTSNTEIWTGTVTEKLDNENKQKSLQRVDKAIAKLLKQFPPNKK